MILIFIDNLSGHRLEFFHHLYITAIGRRDVYKFIIPDGHSERIGLLEWPYSNNVSISTCPFLDNKTDTHKYSILRSEISQCNPKYVVLMDFMAYLPYIAFSRSKTKYRGFIMGIYLYTWENDSLKKRVLNIFKYLLISRCKAIDKIFIQGDKSAALYLNKIYKTNVFQYICDPIVPISEEANIIDKYKLSKKLPMIVHPGDLSYRKGTIDLIKGLDATPIEYITKYCIVFAGRLSDDCRADFLYYFDSLKDKGVSIHFIEGFLSFGELGALIRMSEFIFIPYRLTNQSSGIVGYAAQYKKPVVVTKAGLLSKIVKKNHLGIIIKDAKEETIANFLSSEHLWQYKPNNYLKENTPELFSQTLLQ